MKQKDHKALAYYLMNNVGQNAFWERAWNRRLFLLGCISPDYIPFTYMRGFWKSHGMLGHNADYSLRAIRKKVMRLQKHGLRRWRDCLRMGTLMHYLADSFTMPHTARFSGDMKAHRRYERELHELFSKHLMGMRAVADPPRAGETPMELLTRLRREYLTTNASPEQDCIGILSACSSVFRDLSIIKS